MSTIPCMRSTILGLILAFSFSLSSLRGDTWPVVLTGQPAPGTTNGRFTALGQASMNTSGTMVFSANLDVGGVQSKGIFKVSGGVVSPVALEGQTYPYLGISYGGLLGDPQINNAGDIAFTANFAAGTSVLKGIFLYSGGIPRKLVDTTATAPGAPGQTLSSFGEIRMNDAGDIAFAASLSAGSVGSGIFLMSQGSVRSVINTDILNTFFSLNNHGDIAFADPQGGISLFSNGTIQPLAVAGQAVPNSSLVVLTSGPIGINDNREVVFVNSSPTGGGRFGNLPLPNGIVRSRGGVLDKIVTGGDPVPGIAGATFDPSNFLEPKINQTAIVFTGRMAVNGQIVGIISRFQNGGLTVIAREDQLVEGLGTLNFIGNPNFDDQEGPVVTFVANMTSLVGIFSASAAQFTLPYPQMADGAGSGGSWRTSFILANRSTTPASATISFYDDSGSPMSVGIGSQQLTQRTVTVPALGVSRFQTDGGDALKTGWAMAQADQSVSGIALFEFSDGSGNFIDEVGASATVPLRSFSVFFQLGVSTSTGIAIANPNTSPANVTLILKDSSSNEMARSSITIPAMGHLAKYAAEIFPGGGLIGLGGLEGKIDVVTTQPLAAITLRQHGLIFTSLPVIP